MSKTGCQSGWRANSQRMVGGVAEHQHRLVARRDREGGMAGRMAVGRDRGDAGRDLLARLEPAHVLGDVAEDAPRVEEVALWVSGARARLASSIQKAHSGSGTMISALREERASSSLVLMPLMWSGWKCEITMVSIAAGVDAGARRGCPAACRRSRSSGRRCRCREDEARAGVRRAAP